MLCVVRLVLKLESKSFMDQLFQQLTGPGTPNVRELLVDIVLCPVPVIHS